MIPNALLRRLLCGVLLSVLATLPVLAGQITVGDRSLQMPAPAAGFVELTPDMGQLFEIQKTLVADTNVQFAVYMPEGIAARARAGEFPFVERFMRVQTAKTTVPYNISPADFESFTKSAANQSIQAQFAQSAKDAQPVLERHSEALSKAQGTDVSVSVDHVNALTPEFPDKRIVLIPAQMDVQEQVNGAYQTRKISATTAFTLVNGKLLFLYVYGAADDLDWTKDIARAWAMNVVAQNPGEVASTLPTRSALDLDWGKILSAAIIGGLIAGLGALFRRKKKAEA